MISPTSARVSSPPPSTTITSPGPTSSSARWIARLSPGRVRTVKAMPTSLLPRWNGRRPTAPGSRARLSLITEVGAPLNASIRSGAGFGTLVMAVVMLMQTVSPCDCSATAPANVGSRRRGEHAKPVLGVTAWRNTMKSSVAAKQIAFRMSSYNGFATRRPHPDPPLRRQLKPFEFLVIFARTRHRTRGHVAAGGLQSHLHRPHLLTPS